MREIIERFCCSDDLSTFDPYDIWKTFLGISVKKLFNRNKLAGILPAVAFTLFDTFLNNRRRIFYSPQEYPIVRAYAALILLTLYRIFGKEDYLEYAGKHLQWLTEHHCTGYIGYGWGLSFEHTVSRHVVYNKNVPFSTITPYALEAFIEYSRISGDGRFEHVIKEVYEFFEHDIKVMEETENYLATSYGPMKDRIVTNAVSYTMFAYSLLWPYAPAEKKTAIREKILKLYAYIRENQTRDGSWLYSPQGKSFIDCFHSCIVLKNLIKTDRLIALPECSPIIERGYAYLKDTLFDRQNHLSRRFSVKNKPSIVRFDLYDNAEMLNLASLRGDRELAGSLSESIKSHFCRGNDIYSQIVEPGILRNKNMLRWAVMPYLYAVSQMLSHGNEA